MLAKIVSIKHSFMDYPDPEKSCILIFLSGCSFHCPSCHNMELQDNTMGTSTTASELFKRLTILSDQYKTKSIVFQGGDPLFKDNLTFLKEFVKLNVHTYSVCVYTGFDINFIKKNFNKGEVNFWKTGLYKEGLHRESKKTDKEFILSSSNQSFYNANFKKISKKGVLKFRCNT